MAGSAAMICVTEPSIFAWPLRMPDADVTSGSSANERCASSGMEPWPKPGDVIT